MDTVFALIKIRTLCIRYGWIPWFDVPAYAKDTTRWQLVTTTIFFSQTFCLSIFLPCHQCKTASRQILWCNLGSLLHVWLTYWQSRAKCCSSDNSRSCTFPVTVFQRWYQSHCWLQIVRNSSNFFHIYRCCISSFCVMQQGIWWLLFCSPVSACQCEYGIR